MQNLKNLNKIVPLLEKCHEAEYISETGYKILLSYARNIENITIHAHLAKELNMQNSAVVSHFKKSLNDFHRFIRAHVDFTLPIPQHNKITQQTFANMISIFIE